MEKKEVDGYPTAVVDNSLAFVRKNLKELSADVYSKCSFCLNNSIHDIRVVRNLGELGESLKLDERGNLPSLCSRLMMPEPPAYWLNSFFQEKCSSKSV
jgi:hypothetical protein